jgi:hypothetical protein
MSEKDLNKTSSIRSGPTIEDMELSRVDDQYIARMTAFEVDCNEGRGEPAACHSVGDFLSVVKSVNNLSLLPICRV